MYLENAQPLLTNIITIHTLSMYVTFTYYYY